MKRKRLQTLLDQYVAIPRGERERDLSRYRAEGAVQTAPTASGVRFDLRWAACVMLVLAIVIPLAAYFIAGGLPATSKTLFTDEDMIDVDWVRFPMTVDEFNARFEVDVYSDWTPALASCSGVALLEGTDTIVGYGWQLVYPDEISPEWRMDEMEVCCDVNIYVFLPETNLTDSYSYEAEHFLYHGTTVYYTYSEPNDLFLFWKQDEITYWVIAHYLVDTRAEAERTAREVLTYINALPA